MLNGLKTQITLAVAAVTTLVTDFVDVSSVQIEEIATEAITLGLIALASFFRYLGQRREKLLKDVNKSLAGRVKHLEGVLRSKNDG